MCVLQRCLSYLWNIEPCRECVMPWGASQAWERVAGTVPWAARGQIQGCCCLGDNSPCLSQNRASDVQNTADWTSGPSQSSLPLWIVLTLKYMVMAGHIGRLSTSVTDIGTARNPPSGSYNKFKACLTLSRKNNVSVMTQRRTNISFHRGWKRKTDKENVI